MDNVPKKILSTYSSMYFPKKKEQFNTAGDVIYNLTMVIISWIILGFAVYLSFRCNKGFNFISIILAILFTPFYIIYHFFVTKLCGMRN